MLLGNLHVSEVLETATINNVVLKKTQKFRTVRLGYHFLFNEKVFFALIWSKRLRSKQGMIYSILEPCIMFLSLQ
jgi:hypothetical protein